MRCLEGPVVVLYLFCFSYASIGSERGELSCSAHGFFTGLIRHFSFFSINGAGRLLCAEEVVYVDDRSVVPHIPVRDPAVLKSDQLHSMQLTVK